MVIRCFIVAVVLIPVSILQNGAGRQSEEEELLARLAQPESTCLVLMYLAHKILWFLK